MSLKKLLAIVSLLYVIPAMSQSVVEKNLVKVSLSSFVFKGFGLQYERQVGNKITIAIGYNNIPTSTLAFQSYIRNQINNSAIDVSQFKLGTSVITPEVRFYTGKKGALSGFYLSAYARISKYKLQGPINFTSSTNTVRKTLFDGKLNSVTGGLMAGYNFKLSKKLYLDWWILGASIGAGNGDFKAQIKLDAQEQQSLKSTLDNLDIPFTTTKNTVDNNGATVITNGRIIGLRGLGINLGLRF